MKFDATRNVRFRDDIETTGYVNGSERGNSLRFMRNMRGRRKVDPWSINENDTMPKALREKALSRVFSEEYDVEDKRRIFDPRGPVIDRWNKIFLVACLVSLFIDPLFFYLPRASRDACIHISVHLEVVLTVIRLVVDVFYMIQVFVRFRTAYVAPSSRVFGRGELIIDHSKIAARYLRTSFWLELLACLPLPQVSHHITYIIQTTPLASSNARANYAFGYSGSDLARDPKVAWLVGGHHKERDPIRDNIPIPLETIPSVSALIANR